MVQLYDLYQHSALSISNISVDQSLPNLTGHAAANLNGYGTGVFTLIKHSQWATQGVQSSDGGHYIQMNANTYSKVYQDSANVVPYSTQCSFLIKY